MQKPKFVQSLVSFLRRRKDVFMAVGVLMVIPLARAVVVDDSGSFMADPLCGFLRMCMNLMIPVGGLGFLAAALMFTKGTEMNEMLHRVITLTMVVTLGLAGVGLVTYIAQKVGASFTTNCGI